MSSDLRLFADFMAFSAAVTGFSEFKLYGTGQANLYFSTVVDIVGEAPLRELLQSFRRIQQESGRDESALEDGLRAGIFCAGLLGPIARNVIKLWYVATWYQLPLEWREAYGPREKDTTFVVSAAAYPEGLLWPTIGANPAGAKGPGYGTWSEPPQIGEL